MRCKVIVTKSEIVQGNSIGQIHDYIYFIKYLICTRTRKSILYIYISRKEQKQVALRGLVRVSLPRHNTPYQRCARARDTNRYTYTLWAFVFSRTVGAIAFDNSFERSCHLALHSTVILSLDAYSSIDGYFQA